MVRPGPDPAARSSCPPWSPPSGCSSCGSTWSSALPDELHRGRPRRRRLDVAHCTGASSLPVARPGMAVLGLLTFMTAWNDFFWPLIVLNSENPTVQVAISTTSAAGYVPSTLAHHGRHPRRHRARAHRLRPARPADRRRHHARRGEGMTVSTHRRHATAARTSSTVPAGVPLGRRDRGLPDRGRRRPRTAAARRSGTPSRHTPGRGRRRRHRRRRLRPLPPLRRGRRADARPGPPGATGSRSPGRGSQPDGTRARSTRPGWTSTTGWSTRCSTRGITPARHALPLGPAAGAARTRGGWAGARHRRAVRRLRRRSSRGALGDRVRRCGPR